MYKKIIYLQVTNGVPTIMNYPKLTKFITMLCWGT